MEYPNEIDYKINRYLQFLIKMLNIFQLSLSAFINALTAKFYSATCSKIGRALIILTLGLYKAS
ncbi:hypothetical protein Mucpa_6505 [Mucilaginibacter paludis DSM 18603]|uniref:Uncharacterized protein n=1 Tax=Mucilaginibacter paludis DSM 18603 TaxID=714943 RepID=H1Y9Q6_9SPHI|nr:hypothetical protein Mucpa_6505 [Mucilaginibacter paludis DSM 18603]